VLLVDLDLNGGLAVFLSCLEPKHTLDSALANLDRLDSYLLGRPGHLAPSGFYFVGATALAEGAGPAAGEVSDLLSRVRPGMTGWSWISAASPRSRGACSSWPTS